MPPNREIDSRRRVKEPVIVESSQKELVVVEVLDREEARVSVVVAEPM